METLTLSYIPTDDRIVDAAALINEVMSQFCLDSDEQIKVLSFCMPKTLYPCHISHANA